MNAHERVIQAVRRTVQPFTPGDASLGEIAARATVDGIPIGISLTIIRNINNMQGR